jgi:hypothetical protein
MTPTSSTAAPAVSATPRFTPKEFRDLMRRDVMQKPYRDRLEQARMFAEYGLGFEDLVVLFRIAERDARHVVFGRK